MLENSLKQFLSEVDFIKIQILIFYRLYIFLNSVYGFV